MTTRMQGDAALWEGRQKQKASRTSALGTLIGGAGTAFQTFNHRGRSPTDGAASRRKCHRDARTRARGAGRCRRSTSPAMREEPSTIGSGAEALGKGITSAVNDVAAVLEGAARG